MSWCTACEFARQKCSEECILAPDFPSNDPAKFNAVRRAFTGLAAAVKSLVYEVGCRLRNPIYRGIGLIVDLIRKLEQIKNELANANRELATFLLNPSALLQLMFPLPSTSSLTSPGEGEARPSRGGASSNLRAGEAAPLLGGASSYLGAGEAEPSQGSASQYLRAWEAGPSQGGACSSYLWAEEAGPSQCGASLTIREPQQQEVHDRVRDKGKGKGKGKCVDSSY